MKLKFETSVRDYELLKENVRSLRQKGNSYGKISKELGVAKSTIHYWVSDLPKSLIQTDPEARRQHLMRAREKAIVVVKNAKLARLEAIRQRTELEIEKFPFDNLFVLKAIVSFLYWAEGSKTSPCNFCFANTDPALSLLFLTALRKALPLNEKNIKITLHLHYYHHVSVVRKFWSELLEVPLNQFTKVHVKSRHKTKRKRKNFAGICFIKYRRGSENLKQELLAFAKGIQKRLTKPIIMRP